MASLKSEATVYAKSGAGTPVNVNCPSWLLGHAAFSIHDMILRPFGSTTVFPNTYMQLFKTGSERRSESDYPELQEIAKFLDDITTEAEELLETYNGEEVELPQDLKTEGFFSIENLITHTIRDVAYHCGQLSYLNRLT